MKAMQRRVKLLEPGRSKDLSPALKKWLGHSLTDEEQRALDEGAGVDTDFDTVDRSDWSQEVKEWLGID